MASGSEGTGKMKVEDVEKLMSTDQWDHEVGTLRRKYNRSDVEELASDKDDWVWGYASFILDSLMNKDTQRYVECGDK